MRLSLPFERFEFDVAEQARLAMNLLRNAINGRRIGQPHVRVAPVKGGGRVLERQAALVTC
jgi:hypothetical protein